VVYVDDMFATFGTMRMCHLIADSDEELFAMVDLIGVKRKWHQAPPKHDSHFDISMSKRKLAIDAGAVPITLRTLAYMNRRRKVEGVLGTPEEAEGWFHEWYMKGKVNDGDVRNSGEVTVE
jgi:hypothetical protein